MINNSSSWGETHQFSDGPNWAIGGPCPRLLQLHTPTPPNAVIIISVLYITVLEALWLGMKCRYIKMKLKIKMSTYLRRKLRLSLQRKETLEESSSTLPELKCKGTNGAYIRK